MPGLIEVARDFKFAVLAPATPRVSSTLGPLVPFEEFAFTSSLPAGALDTWLDGIGRFHRDELAEQSFFLWAVRHSESPDVLDHENDELQRDVYRLYLGILIAVPFFSCGRLTSLTGANADGVARVRSLTTYTRTFYTLGAPIPSLTVSRARLATKIARALRLHDEQVGQGRFVRTLRTFREACESGNLDQRLHQFVRSAEGFAVPPFRQSGEHFARRLGRLCAGAAKRQLRELYTIRGGIEHLHGPFDRLPKLSKRKQHLRLLVRCFEAEALARYLILTYLANPPLWSHFASRSAIDAFWSLKPSKLRALWPSRIHYPLIAKEFNYSEASKGKG